MCSRLRAKRRSSDPGGSERNSSRGGLARRGMGHPQVFGRGNLRYFQGVYLGVADSRDARFAP